MEQERVTTWQPIETAPKDGTFVLLLEEDGDPVIGAFVDFKGKEPSGYHNGWFDNISGQYEITPTHWMPLPDPPTAEPVPHG